MSWISDKMSRAGIWLIPFGWLTPSSWLFALSFVLMSISDALDWALEKV